MKDVVVVRTGTANLASVVAGLRRSGAAARIVDDPSAVSSADRVVLPGVGSFGAAMKQLIERDLAPAIVERITAGRPTLAICLGLQLFAEQSEESPGVAGLGIFEEPVCRFQGGSRVPQLGWNRVEAAADCRLLESGFGYFANSFCLRRTPKGWLGATARHGEPFVAAIERAAVLACQFHPELSGPWGTRLIERWLAA